jgi:hypothetical protein
MEPCQINTRTIVDVPAELTRVPAECAYVRLIAGLPNRKCSRLPSEGAHTVPQDRLSSSQSAHRRLIAETFETVRRSHKLLRTRHIWFPVYETPEQAKAALHGIWPDATPVTRP